MLLDTNFDPFHGIKSEKRLLEPLPHPLLAFKSQWFVVDGSPQRYVRVRCTCGRREDFNESATTGKYFICDGNGFHSHLVADVAPLLTVTNWHDVRTPVTHEHDRGEERCPACGWLESIGKSTS